MVTESENAKEVLTEMGNDNAKVSMLHRAVVEVSAVL